jgi:enoyl-CoA hydratase/carnithine racemase
MRFMVDQKSPGLSREESQAVRHLGPFRNATNGVNKMTHSLLGNLIVSRRGPVTLVRLSRPTKRNALDVEMIAGLEATFRDLPEGTRAVVLHGEGEDFCAGADLSMIGNLAGAAAIQGSRACHRAFDCIEQATVPVVAALHGAVIGGGLELAAAAHIRVAECNAYYGLPEGMRGIFVGGGGAVRVARLIGTARMLDMMLTGRTYGAKEAVPLGFSQYVAQTGEGLAKGIALAERAAANPALSNFAMLQALPRIARADPDIGLLMESLMFAATVGDDEARTRIQAFLEKRAPKVSHGSSSEE